MDEEGTDAPYHNNEIAQTWLPERRTFKEPAIDHSAARTYGSLDSEVLARAPEALTEYEMTWLGDQSQAATLLPDRKHR